MIDDEDVREFLIESNENLAHLDVHLVELEERPDDARLLAEVFRTVHTIKGTSGFFGFDRLGSITHVAENILSQLRDRLRELTPPLASLILESVDAVKAILANIEATGEEGTERYTGLVERLEAAYRGVDVATEDADVNASEVEAVAVMAVAEEEVTVAATAASTAVVAEPAADPGPRLAPAIVPSTAKGGGAEETGGGGSSLSDSTIRVDVQLLDKLMNLVGELVLARNQLIQDVAASSQLTGASQRLNHITSELQEGVMKMRMQPIGVVWNKLPRVVRDLAAECRKKIQIEMDGAETELDKTIIEAIKDPLTHIVRNSCDHGIESPDVRLSRGKNAAGKIQLRAFHEGGHVIIEISDDGAGINPEKVKGKARDKGLLPSEQIAALTDREAIQLIFLAGFSTAEKVTNISGRGVGMDVVKTKIEKIGGSVDLFSTLHQGMTVRIKIPLTLAIIPGLVVAAKCKAEGRDGEARSHRFIIPQANLLELIRIEGEEVRTQFQSVHGTVVYRHRGRLLPVISLHTVLRLKPADENEDVRNIVVLQVEDRKFGLMVDHISDTQEIVVKPLGKELKVLNCYVGATIMGDGRVALILDAAGMARLAGFGARQRDALALAEEQGLQGERQTQRLLLFAAGSFTRLAVPLSLVSRLEEFAASRIERASGAEVLHYRGQILPLVFLERALGSGSRSSLREGEPILVIVCSNGSRSLGLVVDKILDVVEEEIAVARPSGVPGLLGSALISGMLTDFIDVHALGKLVGEDWNHAPARQRQHGPLLLLVVAALAPREMLRNALEIGGYRVQAFATAQEALGRLGRGAVDAVVTGADLGYGDGRSLLEGLRGQPQLRELPLFALADDDANGPDVRAAADSRTIFVRDRDELVERLSEALEVDEPELALAGAR
ncbi:chemotaxis protein CheW [Silvibacterium sp.]|uniref:hybrid sensor histidine kinase/response regulator n=1 Tax=Silvibacterium sp. TaxID=1964179 RepID=UPI0039E2AE96